MIENITKIAFKVKNFVCRYSHWIYRLCDYICRESLKIELSGIYDLSIWKTIQVIYFLYKSKFFWGKKTKNKNIHSRQTLTWNGEES